MCVIIIKSKGQPWPSKTLLNKAMDANPDGFSFAWNEDEKVRNYKSLSREDALNFYEIIRKLDVKFTGMIFHARRVSVGDKNRDNCHCWIRHNIGFAHNGTMNTIPTKKGVSDSRTFFEDYFSPAYRAYGMDYALKLTRAIAAPSASRMAFINGNGDIQVVGTFQCVNDKKNVPYYVSNTAPFISKPSTEGRISLLRDPVTGLPQHADGQPASRGRRNVNMDRFIQMERDLFHQDVQGKDDMPF